MTRSIRRRREEAKTDYKARLALLKSGKPRLVIRKTNRQIIAQIVESQNAQDKVVAGADSNMLVGLGWPKDSSGSLKNLEASYLVGFLLGKKAQKAKIKEAILDIGMHRNIKKGRIFAALKGAIDSGLKVPHNAEALPEVKTEKITKIIDKINTI